VSGVQLVVVSEALNVVTDRGRRKLSVVTDGGHRKKVGGTTLLAIICL